MALFKAASAPKLPRIACIGVVTDVADTKISQKGVYNVTNITIEPRGGGYPTKFALLTRPEWLTPGYDPDVELAGQPGPAFVYKTNIMAASDSGPSRLIGLAGNLEKANVLVDKIMAGTTSVEDADGNAVSIVPDEILDAALRTCIGTTVGFVLQQKLEDTGTVDENQKKVKIRTSNYEFGEFFFADDKALAKYRRLAKERPEDWRVGFDEAN